MLLKNKNTAIIGAGPVGLTMARLLQQQGAQVTVYERDKDPNARIGGGTLDLHQASGQRAMQKAGLLDRYFTMAIPMGRTITDEQGNILLSVTPQKDTPEINRNDLREIIRTSLTNHTIVWNSKLTQLEADHNKWHLHFENNTHATAHFVIIANGGMSKARKIITDTEVITTGTFIIQGEVHQPEITCPGFYQRCHNTILMTTYRGITLVANPKNKGRLTYAVTFKQPHQWEKKQPDFDNRKEVIAFLSKQFATWDESYHQLLNATAHFVGLSTRKLSLDQPWKKERPLPITLIGDAAHLMPPFAGAGANTGLLDALTLSENLFDKKYKTIEEAIHNYEQTMFTYAQKAQEETDKNEIALHQPTFSFIDRFTNKTPPAE